MDDQRKNTREQLKEQINNLPADVREAIISVDYQTKLQEITKRQKLLIDQASKLEMETTLVMIGLEPLSDFIGNLQRELSIPDTRAKEIAVDVSESIFKPIRESLHSMNTDYENEESEQEKNAEPMAPKFTNSNEANLNRDQILREIENPDMIAEGDQMMNLDKVSTPAVMPKTQAIETPLRQGSAVQVRPEQEIEIVPGQKVKDISQENNPNILESKMTNSTITSQQIVNAKPETKLPEISARRSEIGGEKKRPSSGVDPYREPIM